ncbi:MAG: phytanoyl-CoA dioxygenase family protein [Ignavibacteria bacterium]
MMAKNLDYSYLDRAPALYSGGVIANTLGFHILRTIFLNIWRMRPKKVSKEISEYVKTMDRDGIVVIPDFFPKEQFEEIKKEFDETYSGWSPFDLKKEEFSKRQNDFPEYFQTIAEKITSPKTPAFTKYFVNNPLITEITSAVVHRKNRLTPHHHFWYLQRRNLEKKDAGHLHSAAFPHADVPYPTIKVFLYMNDVDETNAAYIYAKGSHKMTLKRLLFDYKLSVRYAKTKNDVVTDEDIAKIGYYPESICGKANTLFISNNMGYHNRGDFKTLEPRLTAQLDFRHLETWRNTLYRNDKAFVSKITRRIVKSLDKAKKEKLRASLSHNNVS